MAQSQQRSQKSRLVEGNKLRCPNCEQLGDPFHHFQPLHFVEQYRHELNRVMRHRRDRGGCGHVFSPGDPWIIEAYLAGDLIPKQILEQARQEIKDLKAEISEMRSVKEIHIHTGAV